MTSSDEFSDRPKPEPQPRYRPRTWSSREMQDERVATFRRVEPLAVASLILGTLSFLPMFGWPMLPIPIAGAIVGAMGLRQIANFPGQSTGRGIAIAGLTLSVVLGLLGVGFYAFFVVYDCPIGYSRVNFAELQPDKETGEVIPQKIIDLDGKFIYIKGYMYPGRRSMGIQEFVLVPTRAHCKFCQRALASTEMIKVTMVSGQLADFDVHMVGVGGKLKIDHQEALRPLGGMPYQIEADIFR
ncbi:MAG: DUF4190 domain-containing protein [Pirellulales bacterium]|nr:DUF4190 domain-containing protein [Pirellulales bacterium]